MGIIQPEEENILAQQNVCYQFQNLLWRKLKILSTLTSFFLFMLFSHIMHTLLFTSYVIASDFFPHGNGCYSGILEGWIFFSNEQWYSNNERWSLLFLYFITLKVFIFFPKTASNVWTMLLLYLKQKLSDKPVFSLLKILFWKKTVSESLISQSIVWVFTEKYVDLFSLWKPGKMQVWVWCVCSICIETM